MGTGQALLFASPRQRSLQPAPLPRAAALPVPVCCLQQGVLSPWFSQPVQVLEHRQLTWGKICPPAVPLEVQHCAFPL